MRNLVSGLAVLGALLASTLAPNQARALLPDPLCEVVLATGALVPFPWPDGGSVIVWPYAYDGGMLTVNWLDDDSRMNGVMQHCPTDRTLSWSSTLEGSEPVLSQIEGLLISDQTYSFADVAQALQGLGARARIANTGPGRCGCETFGW